MLLEIFIFLFVISLLVIFLGYVSDMDALKIIGFVLIFMLSSILMGFTGAIEYHNGDNITETASYTLITPIYAEYTNISIGFYLSILAFVGFILVFTERKNNKINSE